MPAEPYVEAREFTLRVEFRCSFPNDYDGDDDGYAWWTEVEPALAELMRAATAILASRPGCRVRPTNRGRSPAEEVTLLVDREAK